MQATEDYSESGSILTDYVQGDYKLSMWIPKDLGGKVIGKRGVVITNLQRESKVKQINALQPVGNSSWIAVVILGGYRNIVMAYNAISDIVEHEVDGVVLEFMINYKKPFFLYGGRKYTIIKRISADTNVRIFFPEFNPKEQPFSEAVPFSLEGECVDVQRAVDELEKEAVLYRQVQTQKFAARNIEYDPHSERPIRGREIRESRDVPPPVAPAATYTRETRDSAPRVSASMPPTTTAVPPPAAPAAAGAASAQQKLLDLVNHNERANSGRQGASSSSSSAAPSAAAAPVVRAAPPAQQQQGGYHQEPSQEMEVEGEEGKTRVKIEKTVDVPSTLVGLLLSKKPKAKVTILNQIQHLTHTVVSKIINPDTLADNVEEQLQQQAQDEAVAAPSAAAGPNRRRRSVGEDVDSDDDSESEGSVSGEEADAVKKPHIRPSSKKGATGKPVFINSENVFVTFRIMGYTEESVDMVIDHLKRIIAGERIKLVLDELRENASHLRNEGAPKYKASTAAASSSGYHHESGDEGYDRRESRRPHTVSGGYLAVDGPSSSTGRGRGRGRGRGAERDSQDVRESRPAREDRPPREDRPARVPREERPPRIVSSYEGEETSGRGSGRGGSGGRGSGRGGGRGRGGRGGPPVEGNEA